MSKEELIRQLQKSPLYAECPKCKQEFKLREAVHAYYIGGIESKD